VLELYLTRKCVAQYVVADEYDWRDLGTPDKVMQAGRDLKQKVFLQ